MSQPEGIFRQRTDRLQQILQVRFDEFHPLNRNPGDVSQEIPHQLFTLHVKRQQPHSNLFLTGTVNELVQEVATPDRYLGSVNGRTKVLLPSLVGRLIKLI